LHLDRRPALARPSAEQIPIPLPVVTDVCGAVVRVDTKTGMAAVVYFATSIEQNGAGIPDKAYMLDIDCEPMPPDFFLKVGDRAAELSVQCHAAAGRVCVPDYLLAHAEASTGYDFFVAVLPQLEVELKGEKRAFTVSTHMRAGRVVICAPAREKEKSLPLGAALDFRIAEDNHDPLREAYVLAVALALDDQSSLSPVPRVVGAQVVLR
jgi:hypothetical protein